MDPSQHWISVVDRLAEEHRISIGHKRFKAEWGKGRVRLEEVVLLKPLTFMNLSGSAVRKVVDFYKMGIEDLVVIHDDLDLALEASDQTVGRRRRTSGNSVHHRFHGRGITS